MIGHLTLEQAKRYTTVGGPQLQWPQLIWIEAGTVSFLAYVRIEDGHNQEHAPYDWYAAPDYLTALSWCEKKKGWHFYRNIIGWWNAGHYYKATYTDLSDDRLADACPSASDLLDAVLDRLDSLPPVQTRRLEDVDAYRRGES